MFRPRRDHNEFDNNDGDGGENIPLQPIDESSIQIKTTAELEKSPTRWFSWTNKYKLSSRTFHLGERLSYCAPNSIINQKYTLLSFLPKILYEQFRFFYNLYFLLVALSQLIPALKIGYLITYFGPLAFVLFLTLSKEAYDDYLRYKRDKDANSQEYEVITEGGCLAVPSSELCVGDFVVIPKNSRVPADCILLKTIDESGSCFLRTDQLDGETDWKLRIAVPETQLLDDHDLFDSGEVYIEEPSKEIYSFFGRITWDADKVTALSVDNTLWMNTIVASSPVLGLVAYTGRDTKASMNTSFASTKVGLVDLEINMLAKILAMVTLILSIAMVALDGIKSIWYIYLMRFLVLFSSIIPISLRVNLDMGKSVYSYLIARDRNIEGAVVRTSTIPEELGRIDYLLTDKTGTLTKNEMEMKKLHMGSISFDTESMDEIKTQLRKAFDDERIGTGINFKRHQGMAGRIRDVVIALALCHNVTPTTDEGGRLALQAASPDEIALVKWATLMGIILIYRDLETMTLEYFGTRLSFKILYTFPFTSETKRMGIILEDLQGEEIIFYQKGADSMMMPNIVANDWLEEECLNFAREGLRTLVVGRKILNRDHFQEFQDQFKTAKAQIKNREQLVANVIKNYLERDLELLGITGVEDKLQDNVKLTIEQLRNAGLRIWMLTGDKVETATCIAKATKLFSRNQVIFELTTVNNLEKALDLLDQVQSHGNCCIVVDGKSLQFYLDYASREFMLVALQLTGVVCTRCTPTQKADIIRMIHRYTNKRTCAIGDGGNDVSMIQTAHVGIGLVGKEGKHASLAADFSINQFQYLSRLLLWHGRNSYHRTSKLAHFVIHRGLIISIMQAVFSALFYFAPIALYQGFLLVGYTTVYTMAPVFSLVYDHDVTEDTALAFPELYQDLRKV